MNIVAINAMIIEHGRLSGVGHYIVQLAAGFAHLIGGRNRASASSSTVALMRLIILII